MIKEYHIAKSTEQQAQILEYLSQDLGILACDTETTSVDAFTCDIMGISFSRTPHEGFYLPVHDYINGQLVQIDPDRLAKLKMGLNAILTNPATKLLFHNSCFDVWVLRNTLGIDCMPRLYCDTLLLKHTVDEQKPHRLKDIAVKYFGQDAKDEQNELKDNVIAKGGRWNAENKDMFMADLDVLGAYAIADTDLTLQVFEKLSGLLEQQGLVDFFYKDEVMPLNEVIIEDMIGVGVKCDIEYLTQLKAELVSDAIRLEHEAHADFKKEYTDIYENFEAKLLEEELPLTPRGNLFQTMYLHSGLTIYNGKDGNPSFLKKVIEEAAKDHPESNLLKWKLGQMDDKEFIFAEYELIYKARKELYLAKAKKKSDYVINLGSTKQLQEILFNKLGETAVYTKKGNATVDVEILEQFAKRYTFLAKIMEWRKVSKLLETYVEGILYKQRDGILRSSWLAFGTDSGRLACIAEGQMVSMPGGDKAIEDVEVGDMVYCFTEEGKPTISKVLNKFDNGIQDCIKLDWVSQGAHKPGSLVCTPDHRIKTRDKGWQEAKDLFNNDRVYHLRRAISPVGGRMRVYGPEYYMKLEEQIIKEEFYRAKPNMHAHHIDGDKSNNDIANIEVVDGRKHTSIHGKEMHKTGKLKWQHLMDPAVRLKTVRTGLDSLNFIRISKFTALKMLAKARGRLTFADFDFNTFKIKLNMLGINIKAVQLRYNSKNEYLSKGYLMQIINSSKTFKETVTKSHKGFYDVKKLINLYGLESNHKITNSNKAGKRRVWDLEVEHHHNFIVNEICVHNCRDPNLMNLPREDRRIKHSIIARPGKALIGTDYAQIEPRVFASLSNEQSLIDAFIQGVDFYGTVAVDVGNLKDDPNTLKITNPQARQDAKEIALGIPYGLKKWKLAYLLGCTLEEAQDKIDKYWNTYKQLHAFMLQCHGQVLTNGFVKADTGRLRRFTGINLIKNSRKWEDKKVLNKLLNLGINFRVQATASGIINRAAIQLYREFKARKWDAHILLQVHDELVVEAAEEIKDEVSQLIKFTMENIWKLKVPLIAEPIAGYRLSECK